MRKEYFNTASNNFSLLEENVSVSKLQDESIFLVTFGLSFFISSWKLNISSMIPDVENLREFNVALEID